MKEKKKLSTEDQNAKMSVLKDIMKDMDGIMSNDLDSKKKMKVSVSANSKDGLEQGLNQAEGIVDGEESCITYPKFGASEQEAGSLMSEEAYDEDSELVPDEQLTSQELEAKIQKLLALKQQKSVKAPF
jgi:hypothetical protein